MSDAPLIGPVEAPQLHVMSFNIRRRIRHMNRRSPDLWSRREPLVKRLLASEQPTLLGVQEALPEQLPAVEGGLSDGYQWIGKGRKPDGTGEHCAIFYDPGRLSLLEWNQQALSDTPHVPGSTSWGNRDPRVVVWAVFRDNASDVEFLAVNTHLDHMSRKSRLHSVDAIRKLVSEAGRPAVVLGDFNTGVGSEPFRNLTADGVLQDAWVAADERLTELWGTFPHYRQPRRGQKRIDWILTSSAVEVQQVGINVTRYDGGWPSDHAPVQAVVQVGAASQP